MRGREGRDTFLQEIATLGIIESFPLNDRNDVKVVLSEVGWKEKYVEILELNRPSS